MDFEGNFNFYFIYFWIDCIKIFYLFIRSSKKYLNEIEYLLIINNLYEDGDIILIDII